MRESSNEKWSWPLVYFHLMIFLTILLESRRWKQKSLSHVRLFATPWTMQSMEFSRPEYCVGSLSLLQGTFPTQESNQGLLHCRQILYQLSYQDRPITSLLPLDDEAGQHFFFFRWPGPSLLREDFLQLPCADSSLRWLLLLQSMGSRWASFSNCSTPAP